MKTYAKSPFSHDVAKVLIGPCGCAAELHLFRIWLKQVSCDVAQLTLSRDTQAKEFLDTS